VSLPLYVCITTLKKRIKDHDFGSTSSHKAKIDEEDREGMEVENNRPMERHRGFIF